MKPLKIVVLAALAVFVLTSCDILMSLLSPVEGVTVAERINLFESDLNIDDRSAEFVQKHFHPDVESFDQIQAEITTTYSPLRYTHHDFQIDEPSSVVESGDTQIATCTFSDADADGTMVFTMKLDGENYKILKLVVTIEGSADEFVIQRLDTRSI